jgi:hypothetical protein
VNQGQSCTLLSPTPFHANKEKKSEKMGEIYCLLFLRSTHGSTQNKSSCLDLQLLLTHYSFFRPPLPLPSALQLFLRSSLIYLIVILAGSSVGILYKTLASVQLRVEDLYVRTVLNNRMTIVAVDKLVMIIWM